MVYVSRLSIDQTSSGRRLGEEHSRGESGRSSVDGSAKDACFFIKKGTHFDLFYLHM